MSNEQTPPNILQTTGCIDLCSDETSEDLLEMEDEESWHDSDYEWIEGDYDSEDSSFSVEVDIFD